MMRKPVIAGNWKMFKTIGESVSTVLDLKPLVSNSNHCEIVVAPTFTSLRSVADRLEGGNIQVAAQDIAAELQQGANTGEISGDLLRDAGCTLTIVGHSERRQYYGETDSSVNRKARAALHFGLRPIICVGELLSERDADEAENVVGRQIRGALAELTPESLLRIIVAYEPVWAIGTGRTATPEQAQEMHAFIRRVIADLFGVDSAGGLRILYGGSVKPENIASLMTESDIDGALVGGASLDAASFAQIVNFHS
jgi:triosephosphate isomerase